MLQDMFGDDAVPKVFKGDKFVVTVDGKRANIDLSALVIFKIEPFIELNLINFISISRRWNVMKTLVFNKWYKLLYLNYINLWHQRQKKYNNLYCFSNNGWIYICYDFLIIHPYIGFSLEFEIVPTRRYTYSVHSLQN